MDRSSDEGPGSVTGATDTREFFREALHGAIARQRVRVRDETEVYLVGLLGEFLTSDQLFVREDDGHLGQEPLAFMLKKAVDAPPAQRARELKRMGDTALYVSGFFSDSLQRKAVDVDYYAAMGGRAYGVLGDLQRDKGSVFRELAEKFLQLVDLFAEISERALVTSNAGILRVYERYARTGSDRLRQLLEDRGVLAVPVGVGLQ